MTLTNTQLILSEATGLLTRNKEQLLFEALRGAKICVTELEKIPARTLNENSQLWAAKQRVKRYREQIVKANLPLVIRVAKRFVSPGITEEQFVSEGLMKLLQCIAAFDVDRGYKFSTYLQRPLYRHFYRFIQKEARRNSGRVWQVDGTETVDTPEPMNTDVVDLQDVLEKNTAGLDAMEHTMVVHFYGINKSSPMTLRELSTHFGFSQGRLKKTLARATEKLRSVLIERAEDVVE